MIKKLLLISALSMICASSYAQFINLQIRVEPELSAAVEQDLDFGQLIINSGIKEIELGDLNMGIFNIRAYYTQNIYVNLDVPQFLTHSNPAVDDVIPLDLNVSYNNQGNRSVNNAIELEGNNGYLAVANNPSDRVTADQSVWQELMLFVYGTIDVGNINEGQYSAEILLYLEYD